MCTSEKGSMLTSANQYLRPEYLPPVSSPLDANKSPLALLAKTCSNIGVDTPSIKSLTGSSSSSNSSSTGSGTSSRATPKSKSTDYGDSSKLNFKPYECSGSRSRSGPDSGSRASPSSKQTSVSSGKAQVPSPTTNGSTNASEKSQSSSAPLSYTSLGLPDMHKDSLAAFYKAYGFLAPNCCPTTGASPYPTMMPPPIALDKTGAYPSIYPPAPSATAAAALAAYNYARMKSGMGLVPGLANPMCRDPYCAGACGAAPFHNSHAALLAASSNMALREGANTGTVQNNNMSSGGCTPATCPNGCNQCEHQRYLAAIAAAYSNSFPGLTGAYPSPVSSSYANSLAAAAALHHRTGAASAVTGTVCNWMAGDTHCGKRFATSEELLQHLKTHTASMQNASASFESRATPTGSTPTPTGAHSPGAPPRPASGTPSPSLSQSARLSASSSAGATGTSPTPSHSLHSNRYHPYSKPSTHSPASSLPPSNMPSAASYSMTANGTHGGSVPPFGPSPFLPSFAPNLYYPYMTPSLFSGRIGPPVPP